jgi:uncharacterized protein (TIGR00730 family)
VEIKPARRICVFCGSNQGDRTVFRETAAALGRELVARGYGLVYGGGNVGLMNVIANAVLAAGGVAIGVIPSALVDKEVAHRGLTELRVVASMHERKAAMAELADGFLALPGGIGTMEELFEVLSWAQLGLHDKPCGLLDVDRYYQPLLAFLDGGVAAGFINPKHRALLIVESDAGDLLDQFEEKWRARSPKPFDATIT